MALGTPTDGGARYSASGGTSVLAAYPASIVAGDCLVLIIGQKPSTANGGTVTTPTGWTLQADILAAGGYGTTLGADTGNTNLRFYTKNTVAGTETGTITVTVGANNICWSLIVRIPTNGGTLSYQTTEGSRTTTPTSSLSVALSPNISAQSGDKFITAMCIPTDVTTPSQFTNAQTTITGLTVSNGELEEPDSATGNDIGGFVGYSHVDSRTATGAATFTATLAGTLTNIRGGVVTLLVREAVVSRTGTLNATETGNDTFSSSGKVVVKGSLSATETGNDTFSATGTVTNQANTGSLAATETGSDTFSSTGDVIVKGSLIATELGNDTFNSSGDVIVKGSLSSTESGTDTFSASGSVTTNTVTGTFSASETGSDSFVSTGLVVIHGDMAANESGSDIFSASGDIVSTGSLNATEGSDTLGNYALDGYFVEGYTKAGWEGLVIVKGIANSTENDLDEFLALGTLSINKVVALNGIEAISTAQTITAVSDNNEQKGSGTVKRRIKQGIPLVIVKDGKATINGVSVVANAGKLNAFGFISINANANIIGIKDVSGISNVFAKGIQNLQDEELLMLLVA